MFYSKWRSRFLVRDAEGNPQGAPTQADFMAELLPALGSAGASEPEEVVDEGETGAAEVEEVVDPEPADPNPTDPDPNQDPAEPSVEETLRAEIARLSALISNPQSPVAAQEPTQPVAGKEPAAPVQAQQPAVQPETPYLSAEELDQIIDNPALILTAIQRAQQDVVKQFTQSLPQVVSSMVNQQVLIQSAVTEFYDQNQDLRPHANYVKFIMGELEQKHKDKTYQELFQMTADESRKRLGLKNPAAQEKQRGQVPEKKPAFAGSRRTGTTRPTGKEKLFDEAAADMLP